MPGGRGTTSGRGNGLASRGEEKRGRLGERNVSVFDASRIILVTPTDSCSILHLISVPHS